MLIRNGQVTTASEGAECSLGVAKLRAESERGVASAERLEDVEKIVRSHRDECIDASSYLFELLLEALDRIEYLERAVALSGPF